MLSGEELERKLLALSIAPAGQKRRASDFFFIALSLISLGAGLLAFGSLIAYAYHLL